MVFLRLCTQEIDFRKIVCWIFLISIRTRNYFQWSIEQQSMWPSTCNREFETESKKQIVVKDFRLCIVNTTTSIEFQFQCIPILVDDILECTKVSLPSEFMTKVLQLSFIHYSCWSNTLISYLKRCTYLVPDCRIGKHTDEIVWVRDETLKNYLVSNQTILSEWKCQFPILDETFTKQWHSIFAIWSIFFGRRYVL